MEPTGTTLEHVIYLSATPAKLATSVRCPTAVSGAMSAQMEHTVLLEERLPQFACLVTTVDKPKLKCHARLDSTVRMVLRHIFLVLQDITVTQRIAVTVVTRMPVPVCQGYVHLVSCLLSEELLQIALRGLKGH